MKISDGIWHLKRKRNSVIEALKKQERMKPIRETDRESLINMLWLLCEDQTNQEDKDYFKTLLQNVEDSPDNSKVTYWCCPICHQILTGYHPHYCSDCGQALDWDVERGNAAL